MANNLAGFLSALGRGLTTGVGAYQGQKRYEDQLAQQALMNALKQAQMAQQGQYQQDVLGIQRQRLAESRRQFDIEQDRRMLKKNLESELKNVYGPGMDLSDMKAMMLWNLLQNPGLIKDVPYSSIFGTKASVVDPELAANRRLEQKVKIDRMLQDIIEANANREWTNYAQLGGTEDDIAQNAQSPTRSTGFLGMGEGEVNPLYEPIKNYAFWNWSNPAARDSAAVLGNLLNLPQYQKFYGGTKTAITREQAIANLRAMYGDQYETLSDEDKNDLIDDEMNK